MKPRTIGFGLASLILLTALAVWGARWSGGLKEQTRAAVADTKASIARERIARADLARVLADSARLKAKNDSLSAQSRRSDSLASASQALATAANKRFEELAGKAPPECAPLAAEARETIRQQGLTIASLTSSRDTEKKRADGLQVSYDDLKAKAVVHVETSAKVDTAATKLIAVVAPKWYARLWQLRPKIGVGGAGGYDVKGKPNAVVGITFGWSF